MARLTYEQIQELKKRYKTQKLYSWSKLDVFLTDKWVYFLKYVKRVEADNKNGAYAVMGGIVHDLLQKYYETDITNDDMVNTFYDQYDEFNLKGYKFDKYDKEKNQKIADKYIGCCVHFLKNHIRVGEENRCEIFVPLLLVDENKDNIILQCYIDFLSIKNDILKIVDYKTSTLYSKKDMEELKNQLIIYGVALHKGFNIPINQIKLYWNFVKYVNVDCQLSSGEWKPRHIERTSIGKNLQSSISMWGKKLGYEDEEITDLITECTLNNSIDNLPKDIREKFKISDCMVEIDFNEQDVINLGNFLLETIKEIDKLEMKYQLTEDEDLFWQEVTKEDLYRLSNLCDYSSELHLPLKKYLQKQKNTFTLTNKISNKITDEELAKLLSN